MATVVTKYTNHGRIEIEGSFDLAVGGAVSNITYPGGRIATCRGDGLSCALGITGTYAITYKNTLGLKMVELLAARASIQSLTLTTAVGARVISVTQAADDIIITVVTHSIAANFPAVATGAAITVGFQVILKDIRTDCPL